MSPRSVSRRSLLGGGAALGIAAPLAAVTGPAHADDAKPKDKSKADAAQAKAKAELQAATSQALGFLQQVTDTYASSGPRLAQSYQDHSGLHDIAFSYDNAVAVIALLAQGDVDRARAIGDALLLVQKHDQEFDDHRVRQAYHARKLVDAHGTALAGHEFDLAGTAVGDLTWCGIALAQLAKKTKDNAYAIGAVWIGQWIYDKTYSESGLGGFSFGEILGLTKHKSTDHNIDVYAFFTLLTTLTGDPRWKDRAQHALTFVQGAWNGDGSYFWTGSNDGLVLNKAANFLPETPQTWSWLALRDKTYAGSVDWAGGNLATTDTPLRPNSTLSGNVSVSGVVFGSGSLLSDQRVKIAGQEFNPLPDTAAVWLEGTAHLALARRDRHAAGDADAADYLLGQLISAQQQLGAGQKFGGKAIKGGLVAASSPLDTGIGFGYYPNLHLAATAWFVLAATGTNPYTFL